MAFLHSLVMNKLTVLVVEDSEAYRHAVSKALRAQGFSILEASDGEEALRICDWVRINVILTDIVMPNMNGIELCRKIKAKYPEIKLFFASAATLPHELQLTLLRSRFIEKTPDIEHFVKEFVSILRKKVKARNEIFNEFFLETNTLRSREFALTYKSDLITQN